MYWYHFYPKNLLLPLLRSFVQKNTGGDQLILFPLRSLVVCAIGLMCFPSKWWPCLILHDHFWGVKFLVIEDPTGISPSVFSFSGYVVQWAMSITMTILWKRRKTPQGNTCDFGCLPSLMVYYYSNKQLFFQVFKLCVGLFLLVDLWEYFFTL